MRLAFYIFLFSQLINLVGVFAEQIKKGSTESKQIKWEKVKENKTNNLKKIIWKSYKDDESYFLDDNYEDSRIKKLENSRDLYKYKSQRKSDYFITEIEPYFPLNNFLDYADFQTSIRWKSSLDGGVSGGTGQQNPSFVFDYGISDSSIFSIYFSEADDDL